MCLVLHGPVGGQTVFSHGIDITPLKLVQYWLRGALPFYQKIVWRTILHKIHAFFILHLTCSHLKVLWFGFGSVGIFIYVLRLSLLAASNLYV
jgi:hypothetical protein